jgi:hypothetical protein
MKSIRALAVLLAVCAVIATAGTLRAQDKTPGLTGADHANDVTWPVRR